MREVAGLSPTIQTDTVVSRRERDRLRLLVATDQQAFVNELLGEGLSPPALSLAAELAGRHLPESLSVPVLGQLAQHDDDSVRAGVLAGLACHPYNTEAMELVLEMATDDPRPEIRRAAAAILPPPEPGEKIGVFSWLFSGVLLFAGLDLALDWLFGLELLETWAAWYLSLGWAALWHLHRFLWNRSKRRLDEWHARSRQIWAQTL